MELEQVISTRRSVRKYQNKPVEREKINACLEAARLAPSACNSQPWEFIVIDDPQVKADFCREVFSGAYKMSAWVEDAPVLVAAVSDKGSFISRMGGFLRRTEFYLVDHGIACEHLVLRAWDLGLGTCWIGWVNSEKAGKFFNLPAGKRIEHLITLGYPAPEALQSKPHARKPFDEMVHYNEYKK